MTRGSSAARPVDGAGAEPVRVAITGLGAVTPIGNGFETLLDAWMAGSSRVVDGVAACEDFEPRDTMTVKEVRRSDRITQFALTAALQAAEQAGWDEGLPAPPARIGCVVGTAFGGLETLKLQLDRFAGGGIAAMSPHLMPNGMYNASPSLISRRLGLRGASCSIASACSSGADAIGMGMGWIRDGVADAVVVGGADASATDFVVSMFRVVGTVSETGVARPFAADRDGFAMGEGAAILVLESYELARARGARVLGEMLGYAGSSDGFHPTTPDPSGRFAAQAITAALADARLEPSAIDYVNAHGTGTRLNDRSETRAIKTALGEHAYRVPISSVKSVTGHLMGGAGAMEAGVSLLAMRRGVVPPTVNLVTADPELDLDFVGQDPAGPPLRRRLPAGSGRIALSTSFGFGGHNAVVCLSATSDRPDPVAS